MPKMQTSLSFKHALSMMINIYLVDITKNSQKRKVPRASVNKKFLIKAAHRKISNSDLDLGIRNPNDP